MFTPSTRPRRAAIVPLVLVLLLAARPHPTPAAEPPYRAALPFVAAPPEVLVVSDEAGLRAALVTANSAAQMPRIEMTTSISLTAMLPPLDNPGAAPATLAGNGHTLTGPGSSGEDLGIAMILQIGPRTSLIVADLTLRGGLAEDASVCGGAAYVLGELMLIRSRVEHNWGDHGGGLCALGRDGTARLTLIDSVVADNNALVDGGGIFARAENGSVVLEVSGSTITHNRAIYGNGGGVYVFGDDGATSTTIQRSTISFNSATGTAGFYNSGDNQAMDAADQPGWAFATIRDSTFSGNVSQTYGGAIGNFSYPPWLPVSLAGGANGPRPRPPAIGHGEVHLFNSTISGNWADRGSGIFSFENTIFTMTGSLVAGNMPLGGDCWRGGGSGGYNLDGDGRCQLQQPTDLPHGAADLLPLALWPPGQTASHALGPASAARDRIPPGEAGCDIGAYEAD